MKKKILPAEELGAIVAALAPGYGIRFEKEPDYNLRLERFSQGDLVKLNEDPALFHIVSQHDRAGSEYYFQYLEQVYFPPDTPVSEDYQFRIYRWLESLPLFWSIASIPLSKKDYAYETAKEANMRLANGIPIFLSGNDGNAALIAIRASKINLVDNFDVKMIFPLNNDNVFTLENVSGSPVYKPGGKQDERALDVYKTKRLIEELWGPEAWVEYKRRCGNEVKQTNPGQQRFDPNPKPNED